MKYLILLMVIACKVESTPMFAQSDLAFESYRNKFYDDAKEYNSPATQSPIIFGTVSDAVAVCRTPENIVIVDKDKWQDMNDTQRQVLIHHELGHCALNRPHYDELPSIMNEEYLFTIGDFERNEDEFIKELFTKEPVEIGE